MQHASSAAGSVLLIGVVEPNAFDAAHVRAAEGVLDQAGKAMDWEYRAVRGGPQRGERGAVQDAGSPKPRTWEEFCQQYRARKQSASAARCPVRTSKKSRQREQLILALLQQPILAKAAASIGISTVTAWRISKTPEFQEKYGAACREDFSRTQARLAHGARAAVSVLEKVTVDKNASRANRARAAHCLFEQTRKALTREDLARRAGQRGVDRREAPDAPSPHGLVNWDEFCELYRTRKRPKSCRAAKNEMTSAAENREAGRRS